MCCCYYASLRPVLTDGICSIQRGFTPKRNFIDNVVDLDACARVAAIQNDQFLPLLASFDYASAFPSLAQEFMIAVFEHNGMPIGLINFAKGIYFIVYAFLAASQGGYFLFLIIRGVIQGCPLAGAFFCMAADPTIYSIQHSLEPDGVGRACADDLGVVLFDIIAL